jgi:carbonic anhydrase
VEGKREHAYRERERRGALVDEQHPFAVVLGCADSRVPPELVYDQGLGDLFTVRVAGNSAADPLVVGSIEFAVATLGCAAVVVLGHERCAAVMAAIEAARGLQLPGYGPAVVAPIVPVVRACSGATDDEVLHQAIDANIRQSVELLAASDVLAEAIRRDELTIVGRRYELASGRVVQPT